MCWRVFIKLSHLFGRLHCVLRCGASCIPPLVRQTYTLTCVLNDGGIFRLSRDHSNTLFINRFLAPSAYPFVGHEQKGSRQRQVVHQLVTARK
jgi:hypothetical protein